MTDEKEYTVLSDDGVTVGESTYLKGGVLSLNDEAAAPFLEAGTIEIKAE